MFWQTNIGSTVTVCVQVSIKPEPSVAVHVTIVSPIGNREGASLVYPAPQLSVIVGMPKFTPLAVHKPESTFTVISPGQLITGAVTS